MLLIQLFNAGKPVSELRTDAAQITIGRDRSSSVVLDDLTRHISRLHATIDRDDDGYAIAVHSRVNPVLVDGRVMHAGQTRRLADGARIGMAPFELAITMLADSPSSQRVQADTASASSAPRFLAWARAALAQTPKLAVEDSGAGDEAAPIGSGLARSVSTVPDLPSARPVAGATQAYLRGLGIPYVQVLPDDEALFLEQAGLLTQSLVETLVGLLRVRNQLRRDFGVDPSSALAAPGSRNPLTSTANPAQALAWLFDASRREPEGMSPLEAVEQVGIDLQAHQEGVAAGLRAAVLGVIGRFDPATFQGAAAEPSSLTIDPAAQSWQTFVDAYAMLRLDLAGGIEGLVAADFRRAYAAAQDAAET